MTAPTVPPRSEIPHEYTWNRESVYPSDAAWEAELKDIQTGLPELTKYQGRLAEGPDVLAEASDQVYRLFERAVIALMYAHMSHEVDKLDQARAGMPGKAQGLLGQLLATASFMEPEMLAIGKPTLENWLKTEPRLAIYAQYLDNLFRKQAHVRSAEVEELLGMLADPFMSISTTAGMLTDADLRFEPAANSQGELIAFSQGNFHHILANRDRTLRQNAWRNYTDAYLGLKNTLANNLATSIKTNIFQMRARRYTSSLEASLFNNNVPVEVFHNLIDTFKKNLPTWHRYFALRRKVLGVDQIEPYDLWAPLTLQRSRFTYPEAVEMICSGLAPMGQEYVNTVRKGCLEERWVDVLPNQGKTSGAFSYGSKGTYPFIVMSFGGDIFSLSTLAHELGHSMHSYLTWQNQPFLYSDYSLFVAEVASNFHQAMVRDHLLKTQTDRDFQIGLIEEAMSNFLRYFLIMPTLARFELETHQRIENGQGLSADEMNELMADLFQEAYGSEVLIDRPRVGITWATFSHLYADYYVYQYATGISGAHALSRRILSGVPGAVEDYLGFLKAGSSQYPLDVLRSAGVDLTTPQPVEETFAVLASYVDRLEKLLLGDS
jgi:oligoendopeptidase F